MADFHKGQIVRLFHVPCEPKGTTFVQPTIGQVIEADHHRSYPYQCTVIYFAGYNGSHSPICKWNYRERDMEALPEDVEAAVDAAVQMLADPGHVIAELCKGD
jgi:hypothetical protein